MSDADLAYAAAVRLIEDGPREGVIDFSGHPEFADLNRIPPQLALDQRVTTLRLMGTKITSIAPLADMFWLNRLELSDLKISPLRPVRRIFELTELSIEGTLVRNLNALTNLEALRRLYMANTPVNDLAPLRSLYDLRDLDLEGTLVMDLRPIRDLVLLGVPNIPSTRGGLIFYNTPAARRDPVLAKLAQINDDEGRTESTIAYLK